VRIRLFATIASGVTAALVGLGCGEEPVPPEVGPRPIKMVTVNELSGSEVLQYPGAISTARKIDIGFEVAGRIMEIPVIEGQLVTEGDLLAALDPRDFQARLDQETAKLRLAEAEFERSKKLFAAEVNSQQEFERKQRMYEVAAARLPEAEKALEDTRLLAPFDGVVAKRYFREFKNVEAKEPVFVFQDDALELIVSIPEADFARMVPGLTLEERTLASQPHVVISSLPGRQFPAIIKEFATTADEITRTFPATFAFAAPEDSTVKPGMTARIVLRADAEGAAAGARIPVQAVLTDDTGEAFVWTVDPDSMAVQRTPVTLGDLIGANVVITSGLSSGQTIATSGVQHLREGMVVRHMQN
jgi:RND family efflux transporter MFP subunit